jgi:hypothetical protein
VVKGPVREYLRGWVGPGPLGSATAVLDRPDQDVVEGVSGIYGREGRNEPGEPRKSGKTAEHLADRARRDTSENPTSRVGPRKDRLTGLASPRGGRGSERGERSRRDRGARQLPSCASGRLTPLPVARVGEGHAPDRQSRRINVPSFFPFQILENNSIQTRTHLQRTLTLSRPFSVQLILTR